MFLRRCLNVQMVCEDATVSGREFQASIVLGKNEFWFYMYSINMQDWNMLKALVHTLGAIMTSGISS